jgi:magnesium transporter
VIAGPAPNDPHDSPTPILAMTRYLRRRPRPVGSRPGTISVEGSAAHPFGVSALRYTRDAVERLPIEHGGELPEVREGAVLWIDLIGHSDVEELVRIVRHYGMSDLAIEDAVDVGQRPKLDVTDDAMFLSLRSISIIEGEAELRREQIALYFTEGLVISIQEVEGDEWEIIRGRIESPDGAFRQHGADYLWYALLDATVDAYYLVLDRIAEGIEGMEEEIFESLPNDTPQRLRVLRREAVALRRAAWPLREALDGLSRVDQARFGARTRTLLSDVFDHVRQVAEVNELMREAITANMETYLSLVGMKQNEIMKVLTLVATIFIPLTFIAGIYGMNFEVMPELGWRYGYAAVWGVMVAVTIAMLSYFRRRGWL